MQDSILSNDATELPIAIEASSEFFKDKNQF